MKKKKKIYNNTRESFLKCVWYKNKVIIIHNQEHKKGSSITEESSNEKEKYGV